MCSFRLTIFRGEPDSSRVDPLLPVGLENINMVLSIIRLLSVVRTDVDDAIPTASFGESLVDELDFVW